MLNVIKHYAMKACGGVDYILLDLFRHLEYNVLVHCQTEIRFALLLTLHIQSIHNLLDNFLDETSERTRH
jgi:hypothetical protein